MTAAGTLGRVPPIPSQTSGLRTRLRALIRELSKFGVVGGIAFAGDRGISRIEVSDDDGQTWREGTIAENPSDAGLSWVIWTYQWEATPGEHTLVVRATDGEGNPQPEEEAPTLPDGASGYHKVPVVVA